MGKIKRRRCKTSRYDPLGGMNKVSNSSSNSATDELKLMKVENDTKSLKGVESLLSKILGRVPEEKIIALNTLASLASEKGVSEFIVSKQVIGSISSILLDENAQLRLAAAGALRNLCVAVSDEVIENMVQQDIMRPLAKLMKQCLEKISSKDFNQVNCYSFNKRIIATTDDDSDPVHLVFIQATHLLWNLCEGSEAALSQFNELDLIHILIKYMNPAEWGYGISVPIVECILCVSENNPSVFSALVSMADEFLNRLKDSIETSDVKEMQYSVILSGILLNLNYCLPDSPNHKIVLSTLTAPLKINVTSLIPQSLSNSDEGRTNGNKLSLEDLDTIVSTQQLSFEFLSNFCCSDEEEEEWSDTDSAHEDEIENFMEICSGNQNISSDTIEAFKDIKFIDLIQEKIHIPPDLLNCDSSVSETTKIFSEKLYNLRTRALQCYQNVIGFLDVSNLGGTQKLYSIWLFLGQWLCSGETTDPSLQEAISGAMRATMDKLRYSECHQLLDINTDNLKQIFEASMSCSTACVRANIARMVGNLGCEIIKTIGEKELYDGAAVTLLSCTTYHLLQMASDDPELSARAEALDVIIDLFSDDKTDKLAVECHLIGHLKVIEPQFKSQYQKQKKKLGDHRPLVQTVKDNLVEFIKYKSKRTEQYN